MRPVSFAGFEHYQISNEGVVVNSLTNHVLKTDMNNCGYKRVTLMSDNKKIRIFVHKLVALHYLGVVEGKTIVNHLDGNKLNNHHSNLEWTTQSENRKHAFNNKLCKRPHSLLNDKIVHQICLAIQAGIPAKDTREVFGLKKHVYDDIRGKRYYKDIVNKYNW